jgi:two-component system, NarL family, sensor kinase
MSGDGLPAILHDSVGQTMAIMNMNLPEVEAELERLTKTINTVKDLHGLVRETSTNIRTISYLLHPPLLDERGLSSALPWYVEGFSERSDIKADLELPEDLGASFAGFGDCDFSSGTGVSYKHSSSLR